MIKRVLISVSDKSGIVELAKVMANSGAEIVSTGGTAKILKDAGINVIPVEKITGFPECLNGRVKTLHPKIHGGILAQRDDEEQIKEMEKLEILPFDMVVVNLYPFQKTIESSDTDLATAIENIDIGGVALIRAAAKNYKDVIIVSDPNDYEKIIDYIENQKEIDNQMRLNFAIKGFKQTAFYDTIIAQYLENLSEKEELFPDNVVFAYEKVSDLRYGENPHQKGAFYREVNNRAPSLASAIQLHGKELSFNNINDANAAIEILSEFTEPTAVAVKHTNPCGVASALGICNAFRKCYAADPVSIFGGIVALNRPVDIDTARELKKIFLEIVIAPAYYPNALELLKKKKNLRILKIDTSKLKGNDKIDIKKVKGGILIQEKDNALFDYLTMEYPTVKHPTRMEFEDLAFAWKVVKHTKSNAIVIAKGKRTLGIGSGQTSRIWAAELALKHSTDDTNGAVMVSDAFFPFKDTVELAAKYGITAIMQPGGSKRDEESIRVCNRHEIAMVFTKIRHFKH